MNDKTLAALSTQLKYSSSAKDWNSALPVGNGRLGAMVFGDPADELIQLNEESIWSGGYRDRNNPLALENLAEMRRLIDEGDTAGADELCGKAFFGTNEDMRHYQPLGDLHIKTHTDGLGLITFYHRTLDLNDAVCCTGFCFEDSKLNEVIFEREVFASRPDDVIVIYYRAEKPFSFEISIDGRGGDYDRDEAYDDDTLIFTAGSGIPFTAAVTAVSDSGTVRTEANRISVKNCESAYIIVSCVTAFRSGDHFYEAISKAKRAARIRDKLKARHCADYKALFGRSSISLNNNSRDAVSYGAVEYTDVRLEKFRKGGQDNKLIELYYNYSKYLMIAGSRPGTLPLNLQGIWNKDMDPAWGSKFTVNINTEMNYWAAEAQNLSECTLPLFDHIERMREHGRTTARKMYGCRGAVCHHNTDIWGDTAPQDRWYPGTLWQTGLAWLCIHIWEHYRFTQDREFLAEKFDTMKEAAEFFLDFLIEDGEGRLVTSPSVSPENTYITKGGAQGTICKAPSMDSQILYTLFHAILSAADILDIHDGFTDELRSAAERLPVPQIGKYGQIMEWAEDYDEAEPGHRHISQLFALCPGEMITPWGTPGLAEAAAATIERRLANGGGHTGWSRAWLINMQARLGNGEKVSENIRALLANSTSDSLLDMHPPFQIDGNFGGGAGIGEALLQSHGGVIRLLPACPPEWESGSARHLRARGGFDVSFDWENGKVTNVDIISLNGEALPHIFTPDGEFYNTAKP